MPRALVYPYGTYASQSHPPRYLFNNLSSKAAIETDDSGYLKSINGELRVHPRLEFEKIQNKPTSRVKQVLKHCDISTRASFFPSRTHTKETAHI